MKKRIKRISILLYVTLIFLLMVEFVSAVWWDNSFIRRQEVNISNAGSAQTNYSVRINITYDGNMQTGFNDLRFTNSTNDLLDFWIENQVNSSYASVWVEIPSLGASQNTTIYLYYGNSSASSASNGKNTFPLFDDFNDGVINSSLWTEADASNKISETNGILRFSGDGGGWTHAIYSVPSFARSNLSFEADWVWRSQNPSYDALMIGWKDDGAGASYTNLVYGYYCQSADGTNTNTQIVYEDGGGAYSLTGHSWTVNVSYVARIRMKGAGGAFYEYSTNNGTTWTTARDSSYSSESTLHPGWAYYSGVHEFDNARVRPWMTTEPTAFFGTEENSDQTPPNIILNKPDSGINTSSTSLTFNFTATEDSPGEINCSLYVDGTWISSNSTTANNTLTNLNTSGISEGNHNWNISCKDLVGNQNWSETRSFYIDLSPPNITSIVYSPNAIDNIDPGTNITLNATITDNRVQVSSVILQYYNGTGWSNATMSNNSAANYNATITTVSSEANYTFNIWANDSFGNANSSNNQTFNSTWDCSWSVSPTSLEETIGFFEDKQIGNVTIINTGDVQFARENCSVNFTTSYSGFTSTYWGKTSWFSNSRGLSFEEIIRVNASTNETFSVTASFPSTSTPFSETPYVVVTSSINDTVDYNNTATVGATIIVSPPNPLLFQGITSYPTSVFLTSQNLTLSAYVRNLGGDGTANNTAYNVSFNWTVSDAISDRIAQGNLTSFFGNLTNNNRQENNLTVALTSDNLASMSKGTLNLTIYSWGYRNNSGNFTLIENSGNVTLLNDTISIQFLCYDSSDGVCVSACGVGSDPDCVQSSSTTTSSGGGGGGGGGGSIQTKQEKSQAYFELVIGKSQEFKLPIENKLSNAKENIQVTVEGIKAEYIQIIPDKINRIDPFSSINLIIKITAPAYFTKGKNELTFTIQGEIMINETKNPFKETKVVTLYFVDISRDEADKLMADAENIFQQMEKEGMILDRISELLDIMKKGYKEVDFLEVKENYEQIKKLSSAAFESSKIIKEMKEKIEQAEKSGIQILETKKLIYIAEAAFNRGDYELTLEKLKNVELTYALETKGEFNLFYTIKNHPVKSSFALSGLILFSLGTSLGIRYSLLKRKLKSLEEEEKIILELMKVVQKECFENNRMSMEEYEEAMQQYERKLSEAIKEKISLESIKNNLLKIGGRKRALHQEKQRLVELVKNTQDDYLNKNKLETRIYEKMLSTYLKRLTEIEEKVAFIEFQKEIKKENFFRKIIRRGFLKDD